MRSVPLAMLTKPYQYAVVSAGAKVKMFDIKVPKRYILFINRIGNSWYANTYYIFKIDHLDVFEPKIRRQIAPVNQPIEIDPPFVAFSSVEVWAVNEDTTDHAMEFLLDGYLIDISSHANKSILSRVLCASSI